MRKPYRRRLAGSLAFVLAVLSLGPGPLLRAQTAAECTDPGATTPEVFGPTDITAVTGNQGLSVGLNDDATVTVLKWPSPSYYDQIKYRTADRDERFFGALPNEGAFIGLGWREGSGAKWKFQWLREWTSKQRYADDDGDVITTTFTKKDAGLTVTVRDVVAARDDALVRNISVSASDGSRVDKVRVFTFANFNPVYSKTVRAPFSDWCTEERNDDGGEYQKKPDAIVHARAGVDESTGDPSSVALVMGFKGSSDAHEVGADTYESGSGTSAYDDAGDAKLSGDDAAGGQADAALMDELRLGPRATTTTAIIAAGFTAEEALKTLDGVRRDSAAAVRSAKQRWWKNWLSDGVLPAAPRAVVALAKRSLISIRQATDDTHDLSVASIATQSPYGLDWIRHGAYVNRVLHLAGHPEMVAAHNERYADLQATNFNKPPGGEAIPPGNWGQNYYADGVVGGPTPYEIDETGLGIWTLWDHYDQTEDDDYLLSVYEAIQLAAQYLTDVCKDPATNLQCVAHEEENPNPQRTLIGAQAVWLGLDSAARAARVMAKILPDPDDRAIAAANAQRWTTRRDEVGAAIDANFFDESCSCYTTDFQTGGTLLWPVGLVDYGSEAAFGQADANWDGISRAIKEKDDLGGYEARALLGNAYAWAGDKGLVERVRNGVKWMAAVPSTDETDLLGEAWMVYPPDDGRVTTMVSQPHVWTHALFFLAAIKAYGKIDYKFD